MPDNNLTRRRLLQFAPAGALALAACDSPTKNPAFRAGLASAENLTYRTQRLILGAERLAPEFEEADISPAFRANGTTNPVDKSYRALAKNNFADWRLAVGGLVDKPLTLSLQDLRALPPRTQITRHDCVEGWSCIGKWTGAPLHEVLSRAGVKPAARYVLFRCADTMEGGELLGNSDSSEGDAGAPIEAAGKNANAPNTLSAAAVRYYETIDLIDARHPQTILAYDMNGGALTVPHGAPLRVRVERQLGYKMAKYLVGIELIEDFSQIADGKGGYWEDNGYEWYAGI